MTEITFELPDDQASILRAKAALWRVSLEQVLQDAVAHFLLTDYTKNDPVDLTPEELAGVARGLDDFTHGRTSTHEEVMAELKKLRIDLSATCKNPLPSCRSIPA